MEKTAVSTLKAPRAVGPYSQAIVAGSFIFTSGQLPMNKEGNLIEGDIQDKARQCLDNIKAILEAAGGKVNDLVKVTVFVTDMGNFAAINEVYEEYFRGDPPARSFVQVSHLPKGAEIEIEGIAIASKTTEM